VNLLLCLGCLVATALGSAAVVAALRLSRVSVMVTGFWVLLTAHLAAETLLVGAVIRQLRPADLAVTAMVVAAVEVGACYAFARAAAREATGHVARVLLRGALQLRRHPLLLALGLLVLAEYAWQVALTVKLPQVSYDGLAYHLIGPDTWIQRGAIVQSHQNLFSDVYPSDHELITAWVGTFLHTMRYAGLTTLPFVAMAASAVTMLARDLKVRAALAVLAGLGLIAVPVVFLQAATAYVDIAGGATVLAALGFLLIVSSAVTFDHGTARGLAGYLLLAGTAAGLAAGIKSTDLVIAAFVVVIGFVQFVRVTDIRSDLPDRTLRPRGRVGAACLAIPMFVLAAFWYLRTWVTWNNPFYPVTILGFPGRGTTSAVIIGANKPPQLRHVAFGAVGAVVKSWLYDLHRHAYIYDQRLGGFGLQWPVIVVPALVVATVWFARYRPAYLFGFIVPIVVLSFASSAAWWSRFTIALAGAGFVCLAHGLERLACRAAAGRERFGRLAVSRYGAGLVSAAFVAATGISMWWATNPTGYQLVENGQLRFGTVQQISQVMGLPHPETVVYPWFSYTELDQVVPVGSTLAIVADQQIFTHPLVGEDLQRHLVALPPPNTADELGAEMTKAKTSFVFLGPTNLTNSVIADPTHFLPVGRFLYQLGHWPECSQPTITIVSQSLSAAGAFRVTGQYTDSCGRVANGLIELWEGDRRVPLWQGSERVIDTRDTARDGSVTFVVTGSPPQARYFLRAERQTSAAAIHGLTVSLVLTPTLPHS
jgi:hypothetical protein